MNIRKLKGRVIARLLDFAPPSFIPRPPAKATYNADGFATTHAASFLADPTFVRAYEAGFSTPHKFPKSTHMEWRVHVSCWAAAQGLKRGGAFVECGVNTGITAMAVCTFLGFEAPGAPPFYLLDTYKGIPLEQFSEQERGHGEILNDAVYYDCYQQVVESFRTFPSVKIVQGEIPGTLAQIDAERISYLSVDLNVAYAEKCVLEQLWDRLVPGAIVVLDDYGWRDHAAQRKVHDEFARSKGTFVLALPTGQGLLMKS